MSFSMYYSDEWAKDYTIVNRSELRPGDFLVGSFNGDNDFYTPPDKKFCPLVLFCKSRDHEATVISCIKDSKFIAELREWQPKYMVLRCKN